MIKPGAGLAVLLAAGAVALSPQSPFNKTAEPHDEAGAETYRVLHSGRDTGCELGIAGRGGFEPAQLVLGNACAREDALADLRFWTDRDDGTVELRDAQGRVALRLATGDGSAFEAFGAGAPLIMLVDAGR